MSTTGNLYEWPSTPDDMIAADPVGGVTWREGQAPNTVNDSLREMIAQIANWRDDLGGIAITEGAASSWAVTLTSRPNSRVDGECAIIRVHATNTGSVTLNDNTRGAIPLRPRSGVPFKAGELQSGQTLLITYSQATNEWLALGSGFHFNTLTNSVLLNTVVGQLPRVGDPVLSIDATGPAPGRIRPSVTAATNYNKADWPELDAWLAQRGYPWGSTATTFTIAKLPDFLRVINNRVARSPLDAETGQVGSHDHDNGTLNVTGGATHNLTVSDFRTVIEAGTGIAFSSDPGWRHSVQSFLRTVTGTITLNNNINGRTATHNPGGKNFPDNGGIYVDIIASTAQAAATISAAGLPFDWSNTTSGGDLGGPYVAANNGDLPSATELYINPLDKWGKDVTSRMTSLAVDNQIVISKVGAQYNYLVFQLLEGVSDETTHLRFPGFVVYQQGTFSLGDPLQVEVAIGTRGERGDPGISPGLPWDFDNGVTAGDPGTGKFRFNSATLSGVTALYISSAIADVGNPDASGWLAAWGTASATEKGRILIKDIQNPERFWAGRVLSLTNNGSFFEVIVSYDSHAGAFTNGGNVSIEFVATGDGFVWRGVWASGAAIAVDDIVRAASGDLYIATTAHTSAASTEPGAGASWATVWDLWLQKGQDGVNGTPGAPGQDGADGADGVGVPAGGTAGQVLAKASGTDYDTQWIDAGGGGGTNPNLLINGDFRFNQRVFAGGALAAGVYGFDRWKAATGGANLTASNYVATLTSGAIEQIVEPAFWGLASFASVPVTVSIDSPSADVLVTCGSQTGVITAGAGRRSVTITPAAGDVGNLPVRLARNGAGTVSFGRVKLELGTAATPWQARNTNDELALAQRYYEKTYDLDVAPGDTSAAATPGTVAIFNAGAGLFNSTAVVAGLYAGFETRKRAAPTITLYARVSGTPGKVRDMVGAADWNGSAANIGTAGFVPFTTAPSAVTQYNVQFHYVADAEI